jgi:hypothetical protein
MGQDVKGSDDVQNVTCSRLNEEEMMIGSKPTLMNVGKHPVIFQHYIPRFEPGLGCSEDVLVRSSSQ